MITQLGLAVVAGVMLLFAGSFAVPNVLQVLRIGIIAGFIGMALAILGGGAALGVMLSKAIAQPQGVAIYDPTRIIRPLDVLVAMANMVAITAHFLGTIASVATVNWLHRQ